MWQTYASFQRSAISVQLSARTFRTCQGRGSSSLSPGADSPPVCPHLDRAWIPRLQAEGSPDPVPILHFLDTRNLALQVAAPADLDEAQLRQQRRQRRLVVEPLVD